MDAVSRLFPDSSNPRTTRVGVEHELLTRDAATGAAASVERVRAATAAQPFVSFEPGGQLELNLPCAAPALAERRLRRTLATVTASCARVGVELDASPVDPRTPAAVPLQVASARYVAMQTHFDSVGPAGRRMMRCTASTQLCLDWWPGRAGLEQWRVLLLAGPFLAAAYARSAGPGSRLATWLAVDPSRTAFDDRLLHGADPVAAYADFARHAARFTEPGEHLSTLFPPVRPRGRYLEVRFLDVQPVERVGELVGVLTALLYDDDLRRRALAVLERSVSHLGSLWESAARGCPDVAGRGHELGQVAA
jgi:gamma-glutamylcysteine synthetase